MAESKIFFHFQRLDVRLSLFASCPLLYKILHTNGTGTENGGRSVVSFSQKIFVKIQRSGSPHNSSTLSH